MDTSLSIDTWTQLTRPTLVPIDTLRHPTLPRHTPTRLGQNSLYQVYICVVYTCNLVSSVSMSDTSDTSDTTDTSTHTYTHFYTVSYAPTLLLVRGLSIQQMEQTRCRPRATPVAWMKGAAASRQRATLAPPDLWPPCERFGVHFVRRNDHVCGVHVQYAQHASTLSMLST